MTEQLHFHFSLSCIGEGNGKPLQSSCLENPRDGEAWWAAVNGIAQSWTRLKQLSSSSRAQRILTDHPSQQTHFEDKLDIRQVSDLARKGIQLATEVGFRPGI